MGLNWQPLPTGCAQFEANLKSLHGRDPGMAALVQAHKPTAEYVFAVAENRLHLGRNVAGEIQPLPNPVSPAAARDIAKKLYPAGQCTEPLLVAGLDQGWLWQTVYELPCNTPRTPGHRPPLYLLARDIERLWVVLHVHDWTKLLADQRVRLFVGSDAVEQCQRSMIEHHHVPWAKTSVTVDPAVWQCHLSGTGAATFDSIVQTSHQSANARMQQLSKQIEAMYAGTDVKSIVRKLRGEKLRVMGITSLFTTFLQYSMRDWLEAFEAMGHEVRMVIEPADHEIANPLTFAEQIVQFKPDLLLLIDHYRAEIAGLPKQIPCVMWVQDNLPNIFSAKAGAAQRPRDYCLGFGRLELRDKHGYPEQRFMPAQVAVNETRFAPRQLTQTEQDTYGCDVSFVSHASTPATELLSEQLQRADPTGKKFLIDVFEQMRSVYDAGGAITRPQSIRQMIETSLARYGLRIDQANIQSVLDFLGHKVNNALFRHQSIGWLADMDVNLHLYGRGWEQHPRFVKFARGIACNQTQLGTIYQTSRINMQITPHGVVHQRLFEGLAAGGFFLMRYVPGDVIELVYRQLNEYCRQERVETDEQLQTRAVAAATNLLQQAAQLLECDPFAAYPSVMDVLRLSADGRYIRSAATVWPEYDRVCYRSADELRNRVTHFLANAGERRTLAESMRSVVLQRFTYKITTHQLLNFMADHLAATAMPTVAAA